MTLARDESFPSLTWLDIQSYIDPTQTLAVPILALALTQSVPYLQQLSLIDYRHDVLAFDAWANMLEMRQERLRRGECVPLEAFEVKGASWLDEGTKTGEGCDNRYVENAELAAAIPEEERQQQTQTGRTAAQRLLQALLPTATRLPSLQWHSTYDSAFVAAAATVKKTGTRKRVMGKKQEPTFCASLPLKELLVDICYELPQSSPSIAVLESLPSLQSYTLCGLDDSECPHPGPLRSLVGTLQQGLGLHHLIFLQVKWVYLSSPSAMPWLVDALRRAPCAPLFKHLVFDDTNLTTAGAVVLGAALSQDAFPALEKLYLVDNEDIGDEGCAALMEGVRAAERMRLSILHMEKMGMGDEGMKALARAVHAGKFIRLESLRCLASDIKIWINSDNEWGGEVAVTKKRFVSDEGMRAFAEAMADGRREEGNERRGEAQRGFVLPKLLRVDLTVLGDGTTMPQVTALVDALGLGDDGCRD